MRIVEILLMPALLAMLSLTLGACCCGVPTDFAEGRFIAEAADGQLVLRNQSAQTIHFFVVEEETAALVDPQPDPRKWPSVPPGGEVRIEYAAVTGYTPGAARALVHWWSEEGGYRIPLQVEFR
jgi:hypothetical protein